MGVVSASSDVNDTIAIKEADDSITQPIADVQDSEDSNASLDSLQITEEDDLSADEGEYIDASEAYECLNQFRCQEGVWQWNEDDSTKTYFNTEDTNWLHPIARDADLEETAKIRAKELYQYFSHTRPDGTQCFTAFPDGLITYGENIAKGYISAEDVTEGWAETNDPYDGQGHRRNMLNINYNCVGIAGYKVNGVIYWVQDFGCRNNPVDVEINKWYLENNSKHPEFGIEMPKDATGNLIVMINGNEIARKTLLGGKANVTVYGLNAGYYDVELVYSGDHNYNTTNKSGSIVTLEDENPVCSFCYLSTAIKIGGDNVKLEKDYSFDADLDSDFKNGIVIPEPITIDGQGHTIDAKGKARIFILSKGSKFINIKFTNASGDYGGAILSYRGVVLENCIFTNNTASKYGGAVYAVNPIYADDSQFIDNTAHINGGALFGEALVNPERSSFVNNKAFDIGGAIYAQGTLSSDYSNYTNNINLQIYSTMKIIGKGNNVDDDFSREFVNATRDYGVVNLDKDWIATQTILINASNVTINGNGHSINAQNKTRIFFITGNNITIRNITLSGGNSMEGGAIHAKFTDLFIIDSTIQNNFAETGAAIDTLGNVYVISSRFIDNTASAGGAIFTDRGNITVVDSLFQNNDALVHGGGAIYTTSKVNITGSVFRDNDVPLYGGVIFTNGMQYGKVYITDSIFTNNTSQNDGGVLLSSLGAEISNSTFTNNSAGNAGGVISAYGNVSISGSNFTGNTAGGDGGVIKGTGDVSISNSQFTQNTAQKSGGVIYTSKSVAVTGSSFINNDAKIDSAAISGENIEISNSNFTNNGGENAKTFSGNVVANNSKIIENDKDVSSTYIGGSGNGTGSGDDGGSGNGSDYGNGTGSGSNNRDDSEKKSDSGNPSATPKIIKKSTKITAKKKTFKAKAKTKKYAITLTAAGKPVKKATVFLKIKGKTFRATTNNKGKATFSIKFKKKGTFKSTITFKGDKYYIKSSKTIKIKFK